MRDATLPIKGGWILCTMVPPTAIRPEYLGLYYARPEKVFERGAFQSGHRPTSLTPAEFYLLYKKRAGAKMSADDLQKLQHADARISGSLKRSRKRSWDTDSAPAFTFDEDEDEVTPEQAAVELLAEVELEMRIRILTPQGEVCLEPHEYTIVPDIEPYIDCIGEEYTMRELGGLDKAKKLKEQLFYVMSRGVPKVEAYKMLLGQIERPNVFWLEPRPEVQDYFRRKVA